MSFEVAVVCAAQGEAAGAGSASKLFFFSSCSFYSTYFRNHTTSFEAQWEANRKQLCYTKNEFKTQDTQITALVPPIYICCLLRNRKFKVFQTAEGLAWM